MNIERDSKQQHRSLLWIRFIGEALEKKSVPIYELGVTLIAIQRIIHKAHLFRKKKLIKGAHLSRDERLKLALEISERKKESDAYGINSFFSDPVVINHIKELIVDGILALGAYVIGKAVGKKKSEDLPRNQIYIGSIYNEVAIIADRIDNIGGVSKIEILSASGDRTQPAVIDRSTQEYVRKIRHKPFFGETQDITGTITRLYPNRNIAEIKCRPGWYVKVQLEPDDFDIIRYQTDRETVITFSGRPIFRLGFETTKFEEFEAYKIKEIIK